MSREQLTGGGYVCSVWGYADCRGYAHAGGEAQGVQLGFWCGSGGMYGRMRNDKGDRASCWWELLGNAFLFGNV